jgi:acetyl esterase
VRRSRELFGAGLFLTMRDVEAFERAYGGGKPGEGPDPRVAPLLAAGLEALPPALVVTAGFDVLRDEGEAFAAALEAAGNSVRLVRFPSLTHDFIHMTDVSPASRRAMREVATEFRTLLDTLPLTDRERQQVKA